jgi:hypothetical protein
MAHDHFHLSNQKDNDHLECAYCKKKIKKQKLSRHENACVLNPKHIRYCPVCNGVINNKKSTTCSIACSNTYFRSGENHPRWNGSSYRVTCFLHHNKKCIICGEDKVVEVHHLDGDKTNNNPENLIPLCPTHHRYWHSKYRSLIEDQVNEYIKNFRRKDGEKEKT